MQALMIVDMQKGLMKESNSHLIPKINAYLKEKHFEKVIYTKFYNHLDSQYVYLLNWKKMISEDEIEICVDQVDDSIVFPKCSYGISYEQIRWLKEQHINEVVLCGTDIDACVLAIAYNLFDNGIKPYFKWDLLASANMRSKVDPKEIVKPMIIRNFGEDSILD